jgi:hypothetical protein
MAAVSIGQGLDASALKIWSLSRHGDSRRWLAARRGVSAEEESPATQL